MTGISDMSPVCMEYYKKIGGGLLIVGGTFLLVEHLFQFGGFDLELVGHEWYGLAMIGGGVVLNLKWKQLPKLLKAIRERNWRAILDEGKRT